VDLHIPYVPRSTPKALPKPHNLLKIGIDTYPLNVIGYTCYKELGEKMNQSEIIPVIQKRLRIDGVLWNGEEDFNYYPLHVIGQPELEGVEPKDLKR
jgi:hypothetical protein